MTTQLHRPTAKIYAFPAGGRAGRSGRRPGAKTPAPQTSPLVTEAEFGSCWYHEAAVEEAEQAPKLASPMRLLTDRY